MAGEPGNVAPTVLTIAGFDPSAGAGVLADIKTLAAHGCYGVACITALTVQSTRGVQRVEPLAADLVAETLSHLAADLTFAAVKIGMLGSAPAAGAVADFAAAQKCPIVLDPVLRSSSGTQLLDEAGLQVVVQRLLPLATVITPNLDEAAALTGRAVRSLHGMKAAAARLHDMGVRQVLITGGHLDTPVDLLSVREPSGNIRQNELTTQKLRSKSTHGTGCAFATALAANLAHGIDLQEAAGMAKKYVREAIKRATPRGAGTGPIEHLHPLMKR